MANNRPICAELQGGMLRMLHDHCPGFRKDGTLLDLGCGTGELSIAFALAFPKLRVVGADMSERCLREAEELSSRLAMANPPAFVRAHFPCDLGRRFDTIFSRSTLHRFACGEDFWRAVSSHSKEDSAVLVYDLVRPLTRHVAVAYVDAVIPSEYEDGRRIYLESFLSSYRPSEARAQAGAVGCRIKVRMDGPEHFVAYRNAGEENWEN